MNNLGNILKDMNQLDEAEQLLQTAVNTRYNKSQTFLLSPNINTFVVMSKMENLPFFLS